MTGLMKVFEIESVVPDLIDGQAIKVGLTDLELQNDHEWPRQQHDICSATKAWDRQLKVDAAVGNQRMPLRQAVEVADARPHVVGAGLDDAGDVDLHHPSFLLLAAGKQRRLRARGSDSEDVIARRVAGRVPLRIGKRLRLETPVLLERVRAGADLAAAVVEDLATALAGAPHQLPVLEVVGGEIARGQVVAGVIRQDLVAEIEAEHARQRLAFGRGFHRSDKRCLTGCSTAPLAAPALATEVYDRGEHEIVDDDASEDEAADDDERYFFGIDIGPYWFAPLGRAFGLNQQSIERRARAVLRGRMSLGLRRRVDDQRYKRGLFRGRETTHSHGSMPEVEDCNAYQSYHAMMFVAGQLLETKPVRRRTNADENPFDNWLRAQLLTRGDDRWLADRRDPEILKAAPSSSDQSDASWCWQVDRQYLDDQLKTDDGMTTLWGHWTTTGTVNGETVSVGSALVPSCYATALLAAAQTSPSPGGIYLPNADYIDHREGIDDPELKLLGWVKTGSDPLSLDAYDPWAGKVIFPGPRPCQNILDVLGPMTDPDARSWTLPGGGKARSESWSRSTGYGEERDVLTGTRLSADDKFIRALLDGNPDTSIIVSIKVHRKPPKDVIGNEDYSFYNYPYNRYYLIGQDGITRSL